MADIRRRLPPLNTLRVFEVAARHLNFRPAAEELGVTQGAVAQQVRGLEADLGVKLFHRHPRTLTLTEAGHGYVPNIRRALDIVADATEVLRPEPSHLTISVTPTFASKWLIPRLPDFVSSYPDIDLRILATDRISNFQTDAVDLAVRFGRPPFGPGLQADLLFENISVAVGSPRLIERLGPPSEGDNLSRYTLLHDTHNQWSLFLDAEFPQGANAPGKNIRFNQISLAIDAAIAGQGLALANLLFVKHDISLRRLVPAFATSIRSAQDFYLVSPRRPRSATLVAAVKDWLVRAVRDRQN